MGAGLVAVNPKIAAFAPEKRKAAVHAAQRAVVQPRPDGERFEPRAASEVLPVGSRLNKGIRGRFANSRRTGAAELR